MQIACEKCATQYVLDENVIPPGGAPVQCTRCGHVFVATPEPKRTTQIFGSTRPAGEGPPQRSGTQVFGVAKPSSDGAPEPSRTTQIFGKTSAPAAPRNTQMFGSVPGGGEPEPSHSTQMFGTVKPPEAAPADPPRSTQIFGKTTAPEPSRSTQIFGKTSAPESPRSTQMFGQASAPEPSRSTQMFGQVSASEPLPPEDADDEPLDDEDDEAPSPERGGTQLFGRTLPAAEAEAARSAQAPRSTQMFGAPSAASAARVELPPEAPVFAPGFAADEVAEVDGRPAPVAVRSARKGGRAIGLALGAAVLMGLVAFGVTQYQRQKDQIPEAAQREYESTVRKLRRDDARARAEAQAALTELLERSPHYLEARLALLVSLLFDLDEQQYQLDRIRDESDQISKTIDRLQHDRSPEDWENRIGVLNQRLAQLRVDREPAAQKRAALEDRIRQQREALSLAKVQTPAQRRAVLGVEALQEGIAASPNAIVLSTRYRSQGPNDGWGALAHAEFALNGRAPPDTLREARADLDAIRATDASFIRTYVLAGRLALNEKNFDAAISALEGAVALNPDHAFARALLARAQQEAREQ